MALWTTGTNKLLSTVTEQQTVSIALPVDADATITLISGKLPTGMKINGVNLIGTPQEVARVTDFRFVLRATLNTQIEDRTFTIKVEGPDTPIWQTPAGDLAVGNNDTFYILDSSPIDFQLIAIDDDIQAGQTLSYFMKDGDGQLPPGTTLTTDGRIIGIVDPLLAIERGEIYSSGFYDTSPYDLQSGGYDFGIRSSNGFDSFFYDTTVWDFSYTEKAPNKLNRYYEFTVNVTDGDIIARRTFKIFVVGDDFFRADNTVLQVGSGTFTADNTNLRTPIWITPGNLGIKRANNYITLQLDIIDTNSQVGFVNYSLEDTNPGTYKLKATGEIIYNGKYEVTGTLPKFIDSGRGPDSFSGITPDPIQPSEWEVIVPETVSKLPTGLELDTSNGEIAGRVPYQAEVTIDYRFTIKATRFTPDEPDINVSTVKVFDIKLLGEINSNTTWNTLPDLGILNSNSISVLRVEAETNVPNAQVLYSLKSGRLPPGLELTYDGEIVGRVNAYGQNVYKSIWKGSRNYTAGDIVKVDDVFYRTASNHTSSSSGIFTNDSAYWVEFNYTRLGLTTIDSDATTFDVPNTTIDRQYNFVINAEDQYKYSIKEQQFSITVTDPEVIKYSNVYLKPFLKETTRREFSDFLSDPEIFIPENIYRPGDPNFGIQTDIKIPIYYGIEARNLSEFQAVTAKNHKRKQYRIGELKTAEAKKEGTNDVLYEVIYVEVIDAQDTKLGRTRNSIQIKTNNKITVDSVNYDPNDMFYDYEVKPSFTIQTRNGLISVKLGEDFNIVTRADGTFNLNWTLGVGVEVDGRTEDNLIKILEGFGDTYRLRPDYANTLKADSNTITVSQNNDSLRYISNINNMRDNLRSVGETNRSFVPLWMRSQQQSSVNELGYTPALVLCYCKPGKSALIKAAIEANGFDFKTFNLDVDRYIIDTTDLSSSDSYLVFANYRHNV